MNSLQTNLLGMKVNVTLGEHLKEEGIIVGACLDDDGERTFDILLMSEDVITRYYLGFKLHPDSIASLWKAADLGPVAEVESAGLSNPFDCVDEPEIPPGELVIVDGAYLRIKSADGLHWVAGDRDPCARTISRQASDKDIIDWAEQYPGSNVYVLRSLARLVVSQEQPPELKEAKPAAARPVYGKRRADGKYDERFVEEAE